MKIITISREFASGGRELGMLLAKELGFNYFDKEIISNLTNTKSIEETYSQIAVGGGATRYTMHAGRTLQYPNYINHASIEYLIEQQKIITELAKQGDCVIVGKFANSLLHEFNPLNIFVYADMKFKVERCKKFAQKDEYINDKKLIKQIKKKDKNRRRIHDLISTTKWGDRETYHLMVNTTNMEISHLVPSVKEYALKYFENNNSDNK